MAGSKATLVTMTTFAPAGNTPPVGSRTKGQVPGTTGKVALIAATLAAVLASWQRNKNVFEFHVTVRLAVFSGLGPTVKNNISLLYSGVPHASARMRVISKQLEGV